MSFSALLVHVSIVFAAAALATCYLPHRVRQHPGFTAIGLPLASHLVAISLVSQWLDAFDASALATLGALVLTLPFMVLLRSLTFSGRFLVAAQLQLTAVAIAWGFMYVWQLDVSALTRGLMLSGVPLLLVTVPFGIVAMIPQWEVLARDVWRRPRAALRATRRSTYPKVSLHVPICSEPPDVVLGTLDALAALEYPNFEVLVIDNNTKDASLWLPVQQWCETDQRFRFFHLESCPGAKAGALNVARQHTAADAVVVGLIDSDYQADPSFLASLIGYFDDPQVGFVQSPHDYREWQHSLYQRMCYWEYRSFFTICVPTWNERGAAITVGTMSLIRRAALEEAGGWSEWCLTEDSELAPRLHALGYTSVYVQESFGRGLIPERFIGYAKQRRRWTYGPIQELKHHLPMFLPRRFANRTALTAGQKLFHLHHDLDPLLTGLGLLLLPIGLATTVSMLVQGERPGLPWSVIGAGLCAGIASQILSWRVHQKAMHCSFIDVLCASVAKGALAHSIAVSALRALFGVPLAWQRTDKFKARRQGLRRPLSETRVELIAGTTLLMAGVLGVSTGPRGLLLLLLLSVIGQGFGYLMSPALALIAEWELRRDAVAVEALQPNTESV